MGRGAGGGGGGGKRGAKQAAKAIPAKSHENQILDAFHKVVGRSGAALLYDIRRALPHLSRVEVDTAIQNLRKSWKVSLEAKEGRQAKFTPEQREAGIREEDHNLIHMVLRP